MGVSKMDWHALTPSLTLGRTVEACAACANTAAVASEGADAVAAVKGEYLAVDIVAAQRLTFAFIVNQVCAHCVTIASTDVKAVHAGCWKIEGHCIIANNYIERY